MASYQQGYDKERFVGKVDRNFICSICFNVLKNPVLCPRNHHCFCRGCIAKHLGNYQRFPTCADELTVETLIEPQRMVKQMLNALNIHCANIDRGCQEILELQNLDSHEATCGLTPAVCTNEGCGATINQRDLIHHESEECEFRKLKCHSCEEMTKTLTNMEKRITNVEKNMETHFKNIQTNMSKMDTRMANVEKDIDKNMQKMEKNTVDTEEKLEEISNKVIGSQTALIEAFNEMKDVLVKMEDEVEQNTQKIRNTPSGDRENIIVAGGWDAKSVEMFNWHQRRWSPLQSMPKKRWGATSFVYNNHVTIFGGNSRIVRHFSDPTNNMIKMNIHPKPDMSMHWSACSVKLPTELAYHSSVVYNEHLLVSGGCNENSVSDCIHEVQLVPPYTVKTLSRMPESRQCHSMEIFDDSLLIVGGTTTYSYHNSLSSVVLYDIKKNEWKQLAPLPYKVSTMATVKWGDNIVVIGGIDEHDKALDTVVIYNVKTEQYQMLPAMRYKRQACTAVVIGNNIVVLGGVNDQGRDLKSVEVFNFQSFTWQELPEMFEERWHHAAVVV